MSCLVFLTHSESHDTKVVGDIDGDTIDEMIIGGKRVAIIAPRRQDLDIHRNHVIQYCPFLAPHLRPASLVQMAGTIHNLNDRVARLSFGRYFLLEGSGHPKE